MDQYIENFCRNVVYLRHLHKLTRREMAQILGISVETLGKIERQALPFRITVAMLCSLCHHFGLSMDTVMKCDLFEQSLHSPR